MVQFLLDQIKKDLRVWWQHPISALALVGLGAMAWNIHLSERIKIMEQRIAAQAAPVVGQSAVVPLPSPISLGDSLHSYWRGEGQSQWYPAPGYVDATIDWGTVPENIEVYAELFVSLSVRDSASNGWAGYARLRDFTMMETAMAFGPLDARQHSDGEPERLTSRPLSRGVGAQTYRLEVSADEGVSINARGRLLYRRRASG